MNIDSLFREAVFAIDAGEVEKLEHLLIRNPRLASERLEFPGTWLRNMAGDALDGYFKQPYLLWFVAGNPARVDQLPSNIVGITSVIIKAVQREAAGSLQQQLDYTLGLVETGRIPRECGVQIQLMGLLIDAGAKPGSGIGALAHGNLAAAEYLIKRGGKLTLAVAACLERMDDVMRLARNATAADVQLALTASAFYGKAAMIKILLGMDADINACPDRTTGFHSHATALHQAVSSGSLDAVKLLVEAGAKTDIKDQIFHGTPLDWAEFMVEEEDDPVAKKKLEKIAAWLHNRNDTTPQIKVSPP